MEHILSMSYGKDSIACLGAIEELGWKLDQIVHVEIWATDNIQADLPPMVDFKKKADSIIKDRFGIEVKHVHAGQTYKDVFYRVKQHIKIGNNCKIYGWPIIKRPWCAGELKIKELKKIQKGCISYIGIASDEQKRFHNLSNTKISPLVEAGWTEEMCKNLCEENGLLSPIYTNSTRGGCWFCHNQRLNNLRFLRKNYPEYWAMMLKWDNDSPVPFRSDGHTVHDFDRRFSMEDDRLISPSDKVFRWSMLDENLNYRMF